MSITECHPGDARDIILSEARELVASVTAAIQDEGLVTYSIVDVELIKALLALAESNGGGA